MLKEVRLKGLILTDLQECCVVYDTYNIQMLEWRTYSLIMLLLYICDSSRLFQDTRVIPLIGSVFYYLTFFIVWRIKLVIWPPTVTELFRVSQCMYCHALMSLSHDSHLLARQVILRFGLSFLLLHFYELNFDIYGWETRSLALKEGRRLVVFENRMLRRMFGRKRDEVIGDWRKSS